MFTVIGYTREPEIDTELLGVLKNVTAGLSYLLNIETDDFDLATEEFIAHGHEREVVNAERAFRQVSETEIGQRISRILAATKRREKNY
jgi:hypothetical protein